MRSAPPIDQYQSPHRKAATKVRAKNHRPFPRPPPRPDAIIMEQSLPNTNKTRAADQAVMDDLHARKTPASPHPASKSPQEFAPTFRPPNKPPFPNAPHPKPPRPPSPPESAAKASTCLACAPKANQHPATPPHVAKSSAALREEAPKARQPPAPPLQQEPKVAAVPDPPKADIAPNVGSHP